MFLGKAPDAPSQPRVRAPKLALCGIRICALSPPWERAAAAVQIQWTGEGAGAVPLTRQNDLRSSQCPLPRRGEGATMSAGFPHALAPALLSSGIN